MAGKALELLPPTDGLDHRRYRCAVRKSAVAHQRPPREEAECKVQHRALPRIEFGAENLVPACDNRGNPHRDGFLRGCVVFDVTHYARDQRGVALIPGVNRGKPRGEAFGAVGDAAPCCRVRQRIPLVDVSGASHGQASLVGEVRIQRVPLHAGPLCDHAEGGRRRPKA